MKNRHSLILLAAAYLFLTISPMACGLDHADGHRSGHHHNSPSHSSFCAWACQANPASGVVTLGWFVEPIGTVPAVLRSLATMTSLHPDHLPVSRGPPLSSPLL